MHHDAHNHAQDGSKGVQGGQTRGRPRDKVEKDYIEENAWYDEPVATIYFVRIPHEWYYDRSTQWTPKECSVDSWGNLLNRLIEVALISQ